MVMLDGESSQWAQKPNRGNSRYSSSRGVDGSSLDSKSVYGPGFQHTRSRPDRESGRSSLLERFGAPCPRRGDSPVPGRDGLQDGWAPRPQPGGRRATPGATRGVREPKGPDPVGSRPPGLRAQAANPPP